MFFFTHFCTTRQHVRGNNKNLRTIELPPANYEGFSASTDSVRESVKKILAKMSEGFTNQAENLWNSLDIPNPS